MKRKLSMQLSLVPLLGLCACVGGTIVFDQRDGNAAPDAGRIAYDAASNDSALEVADAGPDERDAGSDDRDAGSDDRDAGSDDRDSSVDERSACTATLGRWVDNTCGHYICGTPTNDDCVSGGCDCGPGRTFRGGGCATALPNECESTCTEACDSPPPPTCLNDTTLRTYASPGTCEEGICTYSPVDSECTRCPDECGT